MSPLRLAFMGTPAFAATALEGLLAAGHDILQVYCRPPRPAGRGQRAQASAVQRLAEARGLALRTPKTLKDDAGAAAFEALRLDAAVVAAYGIILPKRFLAAPQLGCLNIHASLLPRWRGAAPIARAILAGDRETGITIMQMEEGLDSGPILLQERIPLAPDMNAGALHDALASLGARLILDALEGLAQGIITPRPQPAEGVTYAAKIDKSETRLDWTQAATRLARAVRAFSPTPGAWCLLASERIRVLAAEPVAGQGAPGMLARRTFDGGLRPRRLAIAPPAARRRQGAGGGGIPTRPGFAARYDARMTRYKLTLEYDGRDLVGWQRQANGLSVQELLEEAVFRFCGERVTSHAAGRTDAGVHALGQVVHLDIAKPAEADQVRDALNFHMKPHPVVVLVAEAVVGGFPCPLLGASAALSLRHREPPRAFGTRARPGLAHRRPARSRRDAGGCSLAGRAA